MINYGTVTSILKELGIEYAYYQFNEDMSGKERFIAYLETSREPFNADDKTYAFERRFAIELYTKVIEPETEQKLIDLLDKHDIAWSCDSSTWLEDEKVYITVFNI